MNKLIKYFSLAILIRLVFFRSVLAMCPVCTVAAGAGLGLAKWLGIDDTISGLWIGGFTVSLIMWTIIWLEKKSYRFKFRKILVTLFYFLAIVLPLYWQNIIGHPYHKLWGVDKLLLGIFIGSIVFYITSKWYLVIKAKNNNHAQFAFQKIVMTLSSLLILSGIFYLITK